MLGAAAEFERALIRERTQAGRVGNGLKPFGPEPPASRLGSLLKYYCRAA